MKLLRAVGVRCDLLLAMLLLSAPRSFAVDAGGALYRERCAQCHGKNGSLTISERSKFPPFRCGVTRVGSLLAPRPMQGANLAAGCRTVFNTSGGGERFDFLRQRGNSKQLCHPSRNLGTFFFCGLLGRATTALSDRCEQLSW
jgi:hypothetical protein